MIYNVSIWSDVCENFLMFVIVVEHLMPLSLVLTEIGKELT